MWKTDEVVALIERRLGELRISANKASLQATGGNSRDLIRNIKKGHKPNPDYLAALNEILGVDLASGAAKPDPQIASPQDFQPFAPPIPVLNAMKRDVPIYGTAAGSLGDGAFQMETGGTPIDFARRPPGISEARDVYAMYVDGSSMRPRFRQGELVFVSERRPISIDDDIIIQIQTGEHDPIQTYIKRLVRRTADTFIVEQFNPPATIEFKRKHVVAVHKVLTTNEVAGI
jgi:phage repressor protein C with HTH and peptisase S24 domain